MSAVLVIASREIRERKFVFASAGFAALLVIASTLLPDARGWSRGQMMMLTGSIFATAFAFALAIILGTSVVGRELTNHRMSFYFARPVSASAIWFGKLLGALVTITLCAMIPLIPGLAAGGFEGARTSWATPLQAAAFLAASSFVIFLLMHTASTMTRSRSVLIVADVVLLGIALATGWLIVRPLLMVFAFETAASLGVAFIALLTIAMVFAGAWQLSRGRAELRANHVELSKWTWAAVFLLLLFAAGFVAWLRSPAPGDISYSEIQQTSGDWIAVSGARKNFDDSMNTILLNTRTGEQERVAPFDAMLSGDGSTAVWMERERADNEWGPMRVWTMNLQGVRRRTATGITIAPFSHQLLSYDGSRLATFRAGILSVHDLRGSRLLGSARLTPDHGAGVQMRFVDPQIVRVYLRRTVSGNPTVSVFEYDIARRSLARTASEHATSRSPSRLSADGRLLIEFGGKTLQREDLTLLDARTLTPVPTRLSGVLKITTTSSTTHREGSNSTFLEGGGSKWSSSTIFLQDGRIASAGDGGVRLYGQTGERLKDIPLQLKGGSAAVSEIAGGKLLVVEGEGSHPNRVYTMRIVDLDSGRVERTERGFAPVFAGGNARSSVVLLKRGESEIWRWDVATGEKTLIVKGS